METIAQAQRCAAYRFVQEYISIVQRVSKTPPMGGFCSLFNCKIAGRLYTELNRPRVHEGEPAPLLGDTKHLDDGAYELRIFYGPGLRVYFGKSGSRVVVLLSAGDKPTQKSDIKFAKKYWKDWKENE